MLVYRASQNGVSQRIPGTMDLAGTENEVVGQLGGHNGVEHYRQIAAGRVFHSNRDVASAGYQAVELILHGPCSYGDIRHNIGKIVQIFRIEHLICGGKSCFPQNTHVHMANRQNSLKHIRLFFRIRLMNHAHVALAGSPRLIGVNSGYNNQAVLCLFLNLYQTVNVVYHRVLIICGTGADNYDKLVTFPRKDFSQFLILLLLLLGEIGSQRKLFPDDIRRGKTADKCERHFKVYLHSKCMIHGLLRADALPQS